MELVPYRWAGHRKCPSLFAFVAYVCLLFIVMFALDILLIKATYLLTDEWLL